MVQVWLIVVLNRKGVSQKWLWSSSGFIQHIRGRDWHNVTFRYHCGTAQYSMHAISWDKTDRVKAAVTALHMSVMSVQSHQALIEPPYGDRITTHSSQ